MSKRIPVYLSQKDLEEIRQALIEKIKIACSHDNYMEQQNRLERIEYQLMNFEDYEYGVKKL